LLDDDLVICTFISDGINQDGNRFTVRTTTFHPIRGPIEMIVRSFMADT
jgi:hypothetical protein